MSVAVYCRVSSEEQAERGTIEIQKEFAVKYVDLYHLEIFDYYCDDGISGTIPVEARPEGRRLFNDAKEKKFDTILFYKIDRLGRKVRVILNAVHDLEELGISVCSMTEPLETQTPTGRFMITSLAGISELERDTILSRMWAGSQRAAKLGNWLGGIVPFGYNVVNKQLQISDDIMPGYNLSEADVVQLIFDLSGNQKMSTIKISDYLNALNIPTRYDLNGINGKRKKKASSSWYPSRVLSIIKSTTYKGTHKYGKRATNVNSKLILRPVPAIVSDELWEKANETLKINQIAAMRNAVREYLLRGIIKCGNCGRTYIGTAYSGSGREKIPYYVCNAKNSYLARNAEKCISKNIRADWLENVVLEDCIEILKAPNKILGMDSKKERQSPADKIKKEHAQIKASLKKITEERASIIELYRKKIISEADLSVQLEKLSTEEETLQERLEMKKDSSESAATKQDKKKAISVFKEFADQCQNLDPEKLSFETKRTIVELIVEKITVTTESAPEKYYPEISVDVEYHFATTPKRIAYVDNCTVKRAVNYCGNSKSIGSRIRSFRIKAGMSIMQLASKSNITPAGISNIERRPTGAYDITILSKLAHALNVTLDRIGHFSALSEKTPQEQLIKAMLMKGHTKEKAALAMNLSLKTLYHFLNHKKCVNGTLTKIEKYIASSKNE